jgi:hypothetical protein
MWLTLMASPVSGSGIRHSSVPSLRLGAGPLHALEGAETVTPRAQAFACGGECGIDDPPPPPPRGSYMKADRVKHGGQVEGQPHRARHALERFELARAAAARLVEAGVVDGERHLARDGRGHRDLWGHARRLGRDSAEDNRRAALDHTGPAPSGPRPPRSADSDTGAAG